MRGTFITSMRFECRNATKFGDTWRRKELAVACTIPFRFTFRKPTGVSVTRPARSQSRRSLAEEFLSLPMFPELTEEQAEYVANCVSEAVGVEALV